MADPRLTVIAVFHDMRREAARTLYTLTAEYQRAVREGDYEVVAVDNGSTDPLPESEVTRFGPNFSLVSNPHGEPSPAGAINRVAAEVSTPWVMCLIDGARMLSPGILAGALGAFQQYGEPFVYTIGMHLGPAPQNELVVEGYGIADEDRLLDGVDWRRNGYLLFTISTPALSVGGIDRSPPSEQSLIAWIQHLERSRSWRITRPLRALGALVRRLLGRTLNQPEPPAVSQAAGPALRPGATQPEPAGLAPGASRAKPDRSRPSEQSLVAWIQHLERSRSWRITRPLRALGALVRRLLRQPVSQPEPPAVSEAASPALGHPTLPGPAPAARRKPRREQGFFSTIRESNCFALRRASFLDAGGFDERFRSPGGGLVNLALFNRFFEDPKLTPVCLLGEATFHQFHGGVATNVPLEVHPWPSLEVEYEAIRGKPYEPSVEREPVYLGTIPKEARHLAEAGDAG